MQESWRDHWLGCSKWLSRVGLQVGSRVKGEEGRDQAVRKEG